MIRYLFGVLLLMSLQHVRAQSAFKVENDSVKITGVEMVVRNTSRNIQGYLCNVGNGKTDFRKIGKVIQFSVGAAGFPIAGDSVYISSDFIRKNIKVWRSGLLQNDNINIDTLIGKIIFRPKLIQSEKIYIEVFYSIDFSFCLPNRQYYLISSKNSYSASK